MMEEEVTPPWSIEADTLLKAHLDTDQKIPDATAFKTALIKALSDAYEKGLEDGLVTKATGPDAQIKSRNPVSYAAEGGCYQHWGETQPRAVARGSRSLEPKSYQWN